jgi:PAS domain S-box-containing protein
MPQIWSDLSRLATEGARHSPVREQLDGIAAIAGKLLNAPVAFVSLADGRHGKADMRFVGRFGTELDHEPDGGDPDNGNLCTSVMNNAGALVLHDAPRDPRFAGHPLVTGAPGVRFFAGLPLVGSDGAAFGTLCVMDTVPRDGLGAGHARDLNTLATAATQCLEQWRQELCSEQPARGGSLRFEALANALPQLVWSTPNDGLSDYFNRQWCEFTGAPASASYGVGWLDFVHPDDVALASEAWRHAIDTGEPYTVEFRLLKSDGTYRWMLTRGLPVIDELGRITRWIGTCTDIDERVRTGDLMEFMSRELSHRIKNLFAVVQGLISMALRKHQGMAQVSQALQLRMVALGRAHDLVRPRIAEGSILRSQTTLRELIRILTGPYIEDDPQRLEISGDDTVVNEQAATPLALFFHEMAINSAVFGALSAPSGHLQIAISVGDDVVVEWRESGGPPIASPPEPAFGLGLTKLTVERQLGGTLAMDWLPTGLHAVTHIPLRQLTAE